MNKPHSNHHQFIYPDQPGPGEWMTPETRVDDFIRWADSLGTSDIKLTPTDPVSIRKDGHWKHVTNRAPSPAELFSLLAYLTRNVGAGSQIQRGSPVNFSREIYVEKGNRRSGSIRFRGNATGVSDGNQGFGPAITLRIIPGKIPSFDNIKVKQELRDILFPENGLVILSGVMGSGKTTLLAAAMHEMRIRMEKAIMTLESPIGFDFANIEHARGTMEQIQPESVASSLQNHGITPSRDQLVLHGAGARQGSCRLCHAALC